MSNLERFMLFKEKLTNWFRLIRQIQDKYQINSDCIFNANKTPFLLNFNNAKLLISFKKIYHRKKIKKDYFAMILIITICTDRSIGRPLFIFRGETINENLIELLVKIQFTIAPKGFITRVIFYK